MKTSMNYLHDKLWKSGGYFLLVTCITIFGCFLPFLVKIGGFEIIKNVSSRQLFLNGMNSKQWQFAVVGSIGASVPMALDLFVDVVSSFWNDSSLKIKAIVARFILISSIFIPNLINILILVPIEAVEPTAALLMIRNHLIMCAISYYLWHEGGSTFQSKWLVISHIMISLGLTLVCLDFASAGGGGPAFKWMGETFITIGFLILLLTYWKQIKQWWNTGIKQEPVDETICVTYLVLTLIYGAAIAIIVNAYMNNYGTAFLTLYTYAEAAFTVLTTVSHYRFLRQEAVFKEQLRENEKMFMRYISHEIRTPLNTALMGLALIEKDIQDDCITPAGALKSVMEIKFATDTAVTVLNEMLMLDKVKQGLLVLELTDEDAYALVKVAVQGFDIQAREAGVRLEIVCDTAMQNTLGTFILRVDEPKFAQVIRNLVSNALKFTPRDGSVSVLIEAVPQSSLASATATPVQQGGRERGGSLRAVASTGPEDMWLRVRVSDSGAGISQENISKLFTQEIQFSPGKLQKGGGTGLGLFISKGIVDRHKGFLSAMSPGEGAGTVFTLELPLGSKPPGSTLTPIADIENENIVEVSVAVDPCAVQYNVDSSRTTTVVRQHSRLAWTPDHFGEKLDDDDVETGVRSSSTGVAPVSRPTGPESLWANKRVLVVDDALTNRKVMCRTLERYGAICTEAVDGVDALLKYEAANNTGPMFDLVLMDYQMPNMDGVTAVSLLRRQGYRGPIVGITGNVLAEDKTTMINAGANTVIDKPFKMEVFLAWYRPYLQNPEAPLAHGDAETDHPNAEVRAKPDPREPRRWVSRIIFG